MLPRQNSRKKKEKANRENEKLLAKVTDLPVESCSFGGRLSFIFAPLSRVSDIRSIVVL
jgi:hypothetical protein